MQAMISHGVIGDFRSPDIIRFGLSPLFIDEEDIISATNIIADVLNLKIWDAPKYKIRSFVT